MTKTRSALALVIVLVPALLPTAAGAQEAEDRSPRLAANLALGFGGELDTFIDFDNSAITDQHGDADLDPSVGVDLRAELPVLDFLAIGGMFEFLGTLVDATDAEREESFSFDAYARARWVIEVAEDSFYIEPYVLLPLGFSMAVLPDDDGSGDDIWPGFNTAVLAGAQFLHASGFGGYLELGWRHAEVFMGRSVAILGDANVSLVMNEFALNVGVVYAFGG